MPLYCYFMTVSSTRTTTTIPSNLLSGYKDIVLVTVTLLSLFWCTLDMGSRLRGLVLSENLFSRGDRVSGSVYSGFRHRCPSLHGNGRSLRIKNPADMPTIDPNIDDLEVLYMHEEEHDGRHDDDEDNSRLSSFWWFVTCYGTRLFIMIVLLGTLLIWRRQDTDMVIYSSPSFQFVFLMSTQYTIVCLNVDVCPTGLHIHVDKVPLVDMVFGDVQSQYCRIGIWCRH